MDNLYDFTDVSDLPEALAARMKAPVGAANPLVAKVLGIVTDANEAGLKVLTIRQIETIAFRLEIEVKSQQSLRTALNANVTNGYLAKPSRQSYSLPGLPVTVGEVAGPSPVDVADETDPLA